MFPVEITIPFLLLVTKWVTAVGKKKKNYLFVRDLQFLSLISNFLLSYILTMNIIAPVGYATETSATNS